MEPIDPFKPVEPAVPPTATPAPPAPRPTRLGGLSRGVATLGLAVGLLAIGGAAAVMAASPEPSTGTSPGTLPSTTDDDSTTTGRPPCPEDADGQTPSDDSDGQTPSTSPSSSPSTDT